MIEALALIAVMWVFRRTLIWIVLHLIASTVGAVLGWRLMGRAGGEHLSTRSEIFLLDSSFEEFDRYGRRMLNASSF